jgi:hypothetical protein
VKHIGKFYRVTLPVRVRYYHVEDQSLLTWIDRDQSLLTWIDSSTAWWLTDWDEDAVVFVLRSAYVEGEGPFWWMLYRGRKVMGSNGLFRLCEEIA